MISFLSFFFINSASAQPEMFSIDSDAIKELAKLLDSQEFECVICWENEPNLRLEPCGHSSVKYIIYVKYTKCNT